MLGGIIFVLYNCHIAQHYSNQSQNPKWRISWSLPISANRGKNRAKMSCKCILSGLFVDPRFPKITIMHLNRFSWAYGGRKCAIEKFLHKELVTIVEKISSVRKRNVEPGWTTVNKKMADQKYHIARIRRRQFIEEKFTCSLQVSLNRVERAAVQKKRKKWQWCDKSWWSAVSNVSIQNRSICVSRVVVFLYDQYSSTLKSTNI